VEGRHDIQVLFGIGSFNEFNLIRLEDTSSEELSLLVSYSKALDDLSLQVGVVPVLILDVKK
jgi:hypothetical protein